MITTLLMTVASWSGFTAHDRRLGLRSRQQVGVTVRLRFSRKGRSTAVRWRSDALHAQPEVIWTYGNWYCLVIWHMAYTNVIILSSQKELVDNVKIHEPLGNIVHNQIHVDINVKSESKN